MTGSTGTSPVCASAPGGGPSNAQVQGLGGCGLNKELVSASVGTIWSPVAFVDFGVEYSYGHRQAVSNVKGDVNAITGRATFRF